MPTFRQVLKREANTLKAVFCLVVVVLLLYTFSPKARDNNIRNENEVFVVTNIKKQEPCEKTTNVVPAAFGKVTNGAVRYGTIYGGFDLPGIDMCWLADPGPDGIIVYSFGVGEDCSWDIALASLAPGKIKIYLFDPTPRAKQHFDAVKHTLETKQIPQLVRDGGSKYVNPSTGETSEISGNVDASRWFEQVVQSNVSPSDLSFHPYGLWVNDTQLEFFIPNSGVSHSFMSKGSGKAIKVEARKLSTLMNMFSHKRLDVLKFDVEGAEVRVVPEMVTYFKQSGIWPKMILFDHDALRNSKRKSRMDEVLKTPDIVIKTLLDAGYRLFSYQNFDAVFILG